MALIQADEILNIEQSYDLLTDSIHMKMYCGEQYKWDPIMPYTSSDTMILVKITQHNATEIVKELREIAHRVEEIAMRAKFEAEVKADMEAHAKQDAEELSLT